MNSEEVPGTMGTHRGINMASISGEGMAGLPGVMIATFFGFVGFGAIGAVLLALLGLQGPRFLRDLVREGVFNGRGVEIVLAFSLVEAGACAAYILGERRDRRLAARIQEELHSLNEPDRVGSQYEPAAPHPLQGVVGAPERRFGFDGFKAEELRRAARPSPIAPEAFLTIAVVLFLLWGTLSMLASDQVRAGLFGVLVAVLAGGAIGVVYRRARRRREAAGVEDEPDEPR